MCIINIILTLLITRARKWQKNFKVCTKIVKYIKKNHKKQVVNNNNPKNKILKSMQKNVKKRGGHVHFSSAIITFTRWGGG